MKNETPCVNDPERMADILYVADFLEVGFQGLLDRCANRPADVSKLGQRTSSAAVSRELATHWMTVAETVLRKTLKGGERLASVLNQPPGESRKCELRAAATYLLDLFEELVVLSEQVRLFSHSSRWEHVFAELAEVNFALLEQMGALPGKIREPFLEGNAFPERVDIVLEIVPPVHFPDRLLSAVNWANEERSRISSTKKPGGPWLSLLGGGIGLFFFWPFLLILILVFWPVLVLGVALWVWFSLLGYLEYVISKTKLSKPQRKLFLRASLVVSGALFLALIIWFGVNSDHFFFR